MKKISILFMVFVLTLSFVSMSMAKEKVTFSSGKDTTGAITKLIEIFEEENPDIDIEFISMPSVPNQQYDRYVTMFASEDSSIDVLASDIIWISQFAAAGWIENISDRVDADFADKILAGPLDANMYKGELYGLPWYTDAGVMYYRKDLLDKYGFEPPKTWEELVEQSSEILSAEDNSELTGLVFQAAQIEGITINYLEFLRGTGARVLDKKGNYVFEKDYKAEGRRALQFMHDLVYKYGVAPKSVANANPENNRIMFQNGNAIFMRNWPYAWVMLQRDDSPVKGKVGMTRIPYFAGNSAANTSNLGGWQLVLNKNSEHKEAAWKFMQFMTSYKAQKIFSIDGGHLPTVKSVYKDEEVLAYSPYYSDFFDIFVNAFPRPVTEYYPKLSDKMQANLNAVMSKVKDVDSAYDSMLSEISKIMK